MKALDKFIEENGFRGSQSVKVGYDSLKEFINQRVIEELENIEKLMSSCSGNAEHFDVVEDRIKELKQER